MGVGQKQVSDQWNNAGRPAHPLQRIVDNRANPLAYDGADVAAAAATSAYEWC
jgi:hypothetical protein